MFFERFAGRRCQLVLSSGIATAAPQWVRVGGFAVGHEHVIGRDESRRASNRARPAPVQSSRNELIR